MTDGAPRRDPAELNLKCFNCHVQNWPHMPRVIELTEDGWAHCTACKVKWNALRKRSKGFLTP